MAAFCNSVMNQAEDQSMSIFRTFAAVMLLLILQIILRSPQRAFMVITWCYVQEL